MTKYMYLIPTLSQVVSEHTDTKTEDPCLI